PQQPGAEALNELSDVAQPQVEALTGHRVQGLCRIAHGKAAFVDECGARMQRQGEHGTAPDALEPAQAPAEVIVQPAVEFAGRHAAQGFSLLRAAAPDNAVEVGRLRMWQGSQGAAAGEAFVGPAVARPFGAHVRQDGMLPVMPLYS